MNLNYSHLIVTAFTILFMALFTTTIVIFTQKTIENSAIVSLCGTDSECQTLFPNVEGY